MPKRSAEERIERYRRKIQKLSEQNGEKRRRVRVLYIEDSDDEGSESASPVTNAACYLPVAASPPADAAPTPEPEPSRHASEPAPELVIDLTLDPGLSAPEDQLIDQPAASSQAEDTLPEVALDPELLEALDNCRLLQSPTLNPEIAAVPDLVRNRDKGLASQQQQLGIGITAVNRSLDLLLKGGDKKQIIQHLSNACRILSDLNATFTYNRTKLIRSCLDKQFQHVIQDSQRDETLFENNLSDKIKAVNAIEKQGQQIRKNNSKNTNALQPTSHKASTSGNWTAPHRYQSNRGGRGGSRRGHIAEPALLPEFDTVPTEDHCAAFCQTSCSTTTSIDQEVSPLACESYPGSSEALRQAFTRRGSPPEDITLMLASLSDGTIRQYNTTYKLWWRFCRLRNLDPFHLAVPSVLSFLTDQFQGGCSYGSLNSHRSALSLLLGENIGSDENVKRLLKSAYKIKPNTPKYTQTWDPQLVLNYVSEWFPNCNLTLDKITKKLVILLALCTDHSLQTFSCIKLENIFFSGTGVKIIITDLIKTSRPGREQPVLLLPFFVENINICPATTLRDYIAATNEKRTGNIGKLLLTYKPPHKPATVQTISRWIKQVLSESGVDVSTFSAHSTTSAARWTPASNTFARFYNRPIIDDGNFARSVCLSSNI